MRRAHDVGMHRDRTGGALGIGVDLLEPVDRALEEFRCLMLDQHQGDVVAFLHHDRNSLRSAAPGAVIEPAPTRAVP
jgi:hypothetical protein